MYENRNECRRDAVAELMERKEEALSPGRKQGARIVNSAALKQQKRAARLDFLAAAVGWSTIAALNYLLYLWIFLDTSEPTIYLEFLI